LPSINSPTATLPTILLTTFLPHHSPTTRPRLNTIDAFDQIDRHVAASHRFTAN